MSVTKRAACGGCELDAERSAWCCRTHAYGDVYSSPGLDLRQKQLLASAFLVRPFHHSTLGRPSF